MRRSLFLLSILLLAFSAVAENVKTFDVTYTATIAKVPAGLTELDVWIPLPASRGWQHVSNVMIDAPFPFKRHTEKEFGNQYAFATIPNPPAGDLVVRVRFNATRMEASAANPVEKAADRSQLQRALKADRLVTLSPRVRSLADQ